MSKILIVAHPDDEILWFTPAYFDKIFIFFSPRHDKPEMHDARLHAFAEHPLRDKIEMVGLNEPGLYKDKSRIQQYKQARQEVKTMLANILTTYHVTEVFTHNKKGEYGHSDHLLLHQACQDIFTPKQIPIWCPLKFIRLKSWYKIFANTRRMVNDIELFKAVREIYLKHGAWTWNNRYLPKQQESFYLANKI